MVAARPTENAVAELTTKYAAPAGYLQQFATEAQTQVRVRGSYVLRNLYVRVTTNELSGNSIYRSRKNGANGNLSVTVPGGATGVFEDTTHSDNLVDGDVFNTQMVAGAGTTINPDYIKATIISYTLEAAIDIPILCACHTLSGYGPGTRYFPIVGMCQPHATEARTQYLFRIPAILSNFRVVVSSNTLAGATTMRTRRNGGNGNQSVNIPAGATGAFEDAVNTDSIVNGDLVDYEQIAGGVGGSISVYILQVKSTGLGRQFGLGRGDAVAILVSSYLPLEGDPTNVGPEAWCQVPSRTDLVVGNLFARVVANGGAGSKTVQLRKNGINGNLTIAIPGGATGVFEDNVHSDALIATDLVNYRVVLLGGDITFTIIGLQLPGLRLPTVSTQAATGIAQNFATHNGLLDDDGGEACDCGFEWGETVAYGHVTPTQSKITGQSFSQLILGLSHDTTYHFRAFATNSVGTAYGADMTFTTPSPFRVNKAYDLARAEL
jgi:hypothetical protein